MSIIDLRYAKLATRDEFNAANVVLAFMQPGVETDTGSTKLGDGRTTYRLLAYFTGVTTRTYRGAVASPTDLLALPANISDWATVTNLGNAVYELTALPPSTLANWLGAQVTDVQQIVDSANATIQSQIVAINASIANLNANKPAANVFFADATLLEPWRQSVETRLSGASATAPSLSTDPTIATTSGSDGALGSTMTATTGTVVGTATTTQWQWNRVNATTPSVAILGATATTYKRTAADFNQGGTAYRLTVTETVVGSTGLAGPARTSLQSSATTAAAPSNSVAPAITPSGSQPTGTLLTSTNGTFTGGSGGYTYGIQFYLDVSGGGAPSTPVGARSTTATFTPGTSQTGTVRVGVIATDSNGILSPEAFSNVITVTGTATVTNTSAPDLAATVTATVQGAITQAGWSVSGGAVLSSARSWAFYLNGATTPYRTNSVALYTPEAAYVGQSVVVVETVTDTTTGATYSKASAAKTIQAVPATLAAQVAVASTTLTQNVVATAFIPVTATGGTTPYSFSVAPALPAGVAMSAATGQVTGTPSALLSATTYTVTVTDAVPNTATAQFSLTVQAAGVAALTTLLPVNASGFSITDLSGSNSTTSWDGTTSISIAGTVRLGPVADPNGSGRTVFIERVVGTSGSSSIPNQRSEVLWDSSAYCLTPGLRRMLAFGIMRKVGESASASSGDDEMLVWQTHTPMSGSTQPDLALFYSRQANYVRFRAAYSTSAPVNNATTMEGNPWLEAGRSMPAEGVWDLYAIDWTPGWLSSHGPTLTVYNKRGSGAWTTLFTYTGFTTYNNGGFVYNTSYPRIGLYKYNGSQWNDNSIAFYRTDLYMQVGSNLLANAQQALTGLA